HDNGYNPNRSWAGIAIGSDEGSTGWLIYNNLIYDNPDVGFYIWSAGISDSRIYNNVIYNNGGLGFRGVGGNIGIVENNIVYGNGGGRLALVRLSVLASICRPYSRRILPALCGQHLGT